MKIEFAVALTLSIFSVLGLLVSLFLLFSSKKFVSHNLGWLFFCSSIATFAYLVQTFSGDRTISYHWVIARYYFMYAIIVILYIFVFDYKRIPIKPGSWKFFLMMVYPVVAITLAFANPRGQQIYFSDVRSLTALMAIDKVIVLFYATLQIYVLVQLIVLLVITLIGAKDEAKLPRINSFYIGVGIFLILVTHFLQLIGIKLFGVYSYNMFTYFPESVLALWAVYNNRLADIRPIAYSTIFNQIQEGLLVIDQRGYLIDFNEVAKRFMSNSTTLEIGNKFSFEWIKLDHDELFKRIEERNFKKELNGIPIELKISTLFDKNREIFGKLVSMNDISIQKEAEKLREAEVIRASAWNERVKVASTLHDSSLQYVGSLIMLTSSLKIAIEKKTDDVHDLLDHLNNSANLAYKDLRLFIDELQLEEGSDPGFDIIEELNKMIVNFSLNDQVKIDLEISGDLHLDFNDQRELFYIILESINNSLKHSGCEKISIKIESGIEKIKALISDNGKGFDISVADSSKCMGLKNMRKRANLLKGNLDLFSSNHGTQVIITIPFK